MGVISIATNDSPHDPSLTPDVQLLISTYNELADLVTTLRLTQVLHGRNQKKLRRTAQLKYATLQYDKVKSACRALATSKNILKSLDKLECELNAALTTDI